MKYQSGAPPGKCYSMNVSGDDANFCFDGDYDDCDTIGNDELELDDTADTDSG